MQCLEIGRMGKGFWNSSSSKDTSSVIQGTMGEKAASGEVINVEVQIFHARLGNSIYLFGEVITRKASFSVDELLSVLWQVLHMFELIKDHLSCNRKWPYRHMYVNTVVCTTTLINWNTESNVSIVLTDQLIKWT